MPNNIILFDGVCNFCNGVVHFVFRKDRDEVFHFSPIQSAAGQEILKQHGFDPEDFDTFFLIRDGQPYVKSDAALLVVRSLRKPWRWLSTLRIIPRPIRNCVYSKVAANRYRIFGKKNQCMVPTEAQKKRFILELQPTEKGPDTIN